jgi:hypothetical protein
MTVDTHRGAHEIRLHEINGVSTYYQVFPDSRWVFGSLLFGADKFGDLSLQEPESLEVTMSGTGHLPPAPVRVSFINKAQLRHGSIELGGGR